MGLLCRLAAGVHGEFALFFRVDRSNQGTQFSIRLERRSILCGGGIGQGLGRFFGRLQLGQGLGRINLGAWSVRPGGRRDQDALAALPGELDLDPVIALGGPHAVWQADDPGALRTGNGFGRRQGNDRDCRRLSSEMIAVDVALDVGLPSSAAA